jgi:hypothetical protein
MSKIERYRKLPQEIEAIQFTGDNLAKIEEFLESEVEPCKNTDGAFRPVEFSKAWGYIGMFYESSYIIRYVDLSCNIEVFGIRYKYYCLDEWAFKRLYGKIEQ